MSFYTCSKIRSRMTKCGPNHTTTCTCRFEADVPWTSTAVWEEAYREDPRTRHIYEIAIRRPTARHQLRDAKLSFDDGKFFYPSTVHCGHVPRVGVLRPFGSNSNHGIDQT